MQVGHGGRVLLHVGHDEVIKDLLHERIVVLHVRGDDVVRLCDDVGQPSLIKVVDELTAALRGDVSKVLEPELEDDWDNR